MLGRKGLPRFGFGTRPPSRRRLSVAHRRLPRRSFWDLLIFVLLACIGSIKMGLIWHCLFFILNHFLMSNIQSQQQDFGDAPTQVRETDHYQIEYVHEFVEKWDDLIDWNARADGEKDFFIEELKKRGKHKILDVATGTGYHSVKLLQAGFDVTSVDGSPNMLAKAFENARKQGYILKTIQSDWRWLNRDVHSKYDAIICLGNSFTHLFDEHDRRKVLAEYYSALRHDGILIVDHRNYDSILDHGFTSKHTYYYAGDNVKAEPEYIDEGLARFRYEFNDGSFYHLNMFPLRKEYVRKLMMEVGFQEVETFGDFQETHRTQDPDFYIHIAKKEYKNR